MSISTPPAPPAPPEAPPVTKEEMAALRAAIDQRKADLEAIKNGRYGVNPRNRKYVVDIDWPYREILNYPSTDPFTGWPAFVADNPADAPYDRLTAPFVVDQGTRFYVKSISFALLAVGTLPAIPGVADFAANVVIPASFRAITGQDPVYGAVNFRWKVRSTGNDRDWQNQLLPDWLLQSGSRQGLRFRRAQYCLVGGSEATVTVAPVRTYLATPLSTGLTNISSLRFQFAFGGVEVEG